MRLVKRDPFAREELLQETVKACKGQTCAFCDYPGKLRADLQTTTLYRYHVSSDSVANTSTPLARGKLFCSISCFRAYNY